MRTICTDRTGAHQSLYMTAITFRWTGIAPITATMTAMTWAGEANAAHMLTMTVAHVKVCRPTVAAQSSSEAEETTWLNRLPILIPHLRASGSFPYSGLITVRRRMRIQAEGAQRSRQIQKDVAKR